MENNGDRSKRSQSGRSRKNKKRGKKRKRSKKRRNKEKTKKKPKKERTIEMKKVAEEWEIWDEEEEVKKLIPEHFHEWIHVFGKKQSEIMSTRKLWDHVIETKEGFVPRKGKVYPLLREEREEMCEFIKEQLRKGYIRPLKLPQTAPVFFVG